MECTNEDQVRRERLLAVRRVCTAGATDSDYDEISLAWDATGEDGLQDA